jgi:hypothetical protein
MKAPKHLASSQQDRAGGQYPLWLAILVAVAFIGIGILVWAISQPTYVPEVTGRPNFVVDQTLLDYGTVRNNSSVTAAFHVRNTGDQPLIIANHLQVQVVEGCCPPDVAVSSYSARPGEEITISMTFMMHDGMDGQHDFRVLVQTNDPVNPEQELTVLSNWVA